MYWTPLWLPHANILSDGTVPFMRSMTRQLANIVSDVLAVNPGNQVTGACAPRQMSALNNNGQNKYFRRLRLCQ